MSDVQTKLREHARALLADGTVELVIGYAASSEPMRTTPCFIRTPEDADQLVWNCFCENSLASYAIGRTERIAVVTKACDAAAMVVLMNEKQMERERVHVIAMACEGMVDHRKAEVAAEELDIDDAEVRGDVLLVSEEGETRDLPLVEMLHDCCRTCARKAPVLQDVLLGTPPDAPLEDEKYGDVDTFEALPAAERFAYLEKEFGKCIRCYACREACPICYCKVCFVDQKFPAWLGKTSGLSDTMCFHIMRALHTTGRCVDCGACTQACPNGVDLRKLTRKISKDVAELFGEEAPGELGGNAPLTSFNIDDPEDFIQ